MIPHPNAHLRQLGADARGAISELAFGSGVVAPGLAEPTFAVADTKPVDERGGVGAQAVPPDVANLRPNPEIVSGDLVPIAPRVVLGFVGAVLFLELVVERIRTP
jgi:hypothetical protein